MSVYDYRDRPAYRPAVAPPEYSKNHHILKWWTPAHDDVIADQISTYQWGWYWHITDALVEITSPDTIDSWKQLDPVCTEYAWYNVLMYFAISRAEMIGLTRKIRSPEWKTCPLCGNPFVEDSLPQPLIDRLGTDQIDFCSPCLCDTLLAEGNESVSREDIVEYLVSLTALLERVPTQNFGQGKPDVIEMGSQQRLALLRLLRDKPSIRRVKEVCGSWLNALIEAGVLEDGTRRTALGTQCIAEDGHLCLSLGEKTIDDFLSRRGVEHEKEPPYPDSRYRADFKVGDVLIEYLGLVGNAEYDARTEVKTQLAKQSGIRLIKVLPEDLISRSKLNRKLSEIVGSSHGKGSQGPCPRGEE